MLHQAPADKREINKSTIDVHDFTNFPFALSKSFISEVNGTSKNFHTTDDQSKLEIPEMNKAPSQSFH